MRIWHQGLVVLDDVPDYRTALDKHIKSAVRPGTEVVIHGLNPGTYTRDYPIGDLQHGTFSYLHHTQTLAAAVAAEQQGFGAYAMGFLSSGLLQEARSLVEIPVVCYGEAACHFASFYGQRFGMIRFAPELIRRTEEIVRGMGFEKNFAGVAPAGFTYQDIFGKFENAGATIDRFKETVRRFVKETGADVIIPGEMPMNVFLASNGVNRVDDVPIVDGMAVTLLLAEMMVDMRQRLGLFHSRHGQANMEPPKKRLRQIVEFYGMEKVWQAMGVDPSRMT